MEQSSPQLETEVERAKNLQKLLQNIANSGLNQLDKEDLKQVKKICKTDQDAIPFAYDNLMKSMKRKHSQVRLSCFQLLDELFQRSHALRELVVRDLHDVIKLVMETESGDRLPPPREARENLKKLSLERIKSWVEKFGSGYKKLELAFNYLKQVRKVDFNDLEARSELQRRQDEEKKKKLDNIWKERVKKVKLEMEESKIDIQDCLTQIDNCFQLLVPSLELLGSNESSEEDVDEDSRRELGILGNGRQTFSIEINSDASVVQENPDNSAILENLGDQCALLRNRYLPLVKKWAVTLTKAGDSGDPDTLKKTIDIKQLLEEAEIKSKNFKIPDKIERSKHDPDDDDSSSTDDEDFVEVESKSGYEASVKIPDDFSIFGDPIPSTSGISISNLPKAMKNSKQVTKKSENIPVVDFNPLDPPKPLKVLVDSEKLRFWGSGNSHDGEMTIPGSDGTERSIEFIGKFEPVEWSCRAPLPSGKLCPRYDRYKCPFHGKIIPRDKLGQPSNLEDLRIEQNAKEKAQAENPDWQDPGLLRDIKEATGIDLKLPKKGQKRKKSEESKYPGLKAIVEEENTPRKRLHKKLFNRSTMKRVANTLNRLDAKRHTDKFADQFNYLFTK